MAYMFGLGSGWLSSKAAKAAKAEGAVLVNYTDPQCKCGRGCPRHKCKASRRHWFEGRNLGEPHDSQLARRVLDAVAATEEE